MNRKRLFVKTLTMAAMSVAVMAQVPARAANVNVGVVISGKVQPGVYGRVEIGSRPPPPVLYAQPVVIVHERHRVPYQPIYLHVPPGHAKHWSKFCYRYDACGRPVYFVKSAEYEPGYRHREDDHHDRGHDKHGHGRGD